MAYICTPREVTGLRGIRKKSVCRLHPNWLNASGGFVNEDWQFDYDQSKRHYSTIDDVENGNDLPHTSNGPYLHIASNCSLPLFQEVGNIPYSRGILLQHKANLGFTHSTIGFTPWSSNTTSTPTGDVAEITIRLGFYWQNLFPFMEVLRRDKPWLKIVGYYNVNKFKERVEITCTNVALVGTYDAYGFMIHPTYSTQVTTLVDETIEHTITMTSFAEEFRTHSLDTNFSQNDATYVNELGQLITYQTYNMWENRNFSINPLLLYATNL